MLLEIDRQINVDRAMRGAVKSLKDEDPISFSLTVLIVLLHKYSSRLHEQIFLKIQAAQSLVDQKLELKYIISDDQTFYSLFRTIRKDVTVFDATSPAGLDIEWVTDAEEINLKNRVRLMPSKKYNLFDVIFSSDPVSFFHHLLARGSQHYRILASNAERNPNLTVSNLDYFSTVELKNTMSLAYGPEDAQISAPEFLDQLFEATVEHHLTQRAVVCGEKSITYHGLSKKVNQLAHVLKKNGILPGDKAGILLNRSLEAYTAMLAIMKCGAAYVPIDSDNPKERVNYILEDSAAKLLISHSFFKHLHEDFAGHVLHVDKELMAAFSDSTDQPSDDIGITERSTQDAAYIIYTSGSTGKPKGVAVSHAAASNFVKAERSMFRLRPLDKIAQGFSIAFDASIEEIWLAFASGATLYPVDNEIMCSGNDLSEFINHTKITVLSTIPTLLYSLTPPLVSLRLLVLGAETCPKELLRRWSNSKLRIVNTYGPTETTVIATATDLDADKEVSIGRPIANCALFITDESLKPVAVGVPGELCIAGKGLGIGYQNDPERTNERFVAPPFGMKAHVIDRIYRTGDLGRLHEDGEIEFLGRLDAQVKLRGYRIELSEIEALLLSFPNIKNAAVALKTNPAGADFLIAYLILDDKSTPLNVSLIKEFLGKRIASYMIPSLFEEIDELPLQPGGKIDRKRVNEIPLDLPGKKRRTESFTPLDRRIYEIWSKYFSIKTISK